MESALLMVVTMAGAGGASPSSLAPETALALDIAEAVGATVREVRLEPDASITQAEAEALRTALRNTGLFLLVKTAASPSISLRRMAPDVVLATVANGDGERLWVGRALWPTAESGEDEPQTKPTAGQPEDQRLERILAFRRDHLGVSPVSTTVMAWPLTFGFGHWQHGSGGLGVPYGWQGAGYGPVPYTTRSGWAVVRGQTTALDELEFARLIGDTELAAKIEETRFDRRLAWALGFGGGAAVGIGGGAALYWGNPDTLGTPDRTRTVGMSLMVLGVVSGVMTAMTPIIGVDPIQKPEEAQQRCDAYNLQRLRDLGLTAEDLQLVGSQP